MNKRDISKLVSKEFEYDKWIKQIPDLNFNKDWIVRLSPSYGGAVVRVHIADNRTIKNTERKYVSVYLDCYDLLGCVYEPYWEVYPVECGYDGEKVADCARCLLNESDLLIDLIQRSLDYLAESYE